ncbi:BTB/POZ fold [Artemisia annua]|uniref:BTB/POZ fold n=1 Tax=Artemisia annua TaxID=35608 RepID=A0A2U1MCJ4_ARTAN|nr:BTB/POZ fold [Artemisia annua]
MTMMVCFTLLFCGNSFRPRFRCSCVYNACSVCVPNGCFMCVPLSLIGNAFGEALLLIIVGIQLRFIWKGGGKKFCTTDDTLTQREPHSMLAAMFSGRHTVCKDIDKVNANWRVKSEDMSDLCINVTKQVNAYWRIHRPLVHGNRDKVGDGSKPIQ